MPMYIQSCVLRADGPIYYATREIGRLYETGDHLHNYALTYALGFARSAYHADSLSPTYREQWRIRHAGNSAPCRAHD